MSSSPIVVLVPVAGCGLHYDMLNFDDPGVTLLPGDLLVLSGGYWFAESSWIENKLDPNDPGIRTRRHNRLIRLDEGHCLLTISSDETIEPENGRRCRRWYVRAMMGTVPVQTILFPDDAMRAKEMGKEPQVYFKIIRTA